MNAPKHTNRLAKEKSPYLLQHAHNPVDWYPWGEEAFRKAKEEDKPIFLSIGYSTCHWCHVMERESFEDEAVAAFLNQHFVPVKVDREERPDVDQIYMAYVQQAARHGGWPLSVFLTPDRKPFFGGTYFPPKAQGPMPAFIDVLREMEKLWTGQRERVDQVAAQNSKGIQLFVERSVEGDLTAAVFEKAHEEYEAQFDATWGGFGRQPKFPMSTNLSFLLRYHKRSGNPKALRMVEKTLEMMFRGGMYDHLGGGFHRYSTDYRWLVPHFEKMLYDNALLARAYLEAYQSTGKEIYARVARETLDYVLRDMTDPNGGFYSAEDADSEGEEGLFYVWTPKEFEEVLGKEGGALLGRYYGVTEEGNFEVGKSILHLPIPPERFAAGAGIDEEEWQAMLARGKKALLEHRSRRIRPHRDDKIITSWNGLMISTMAFAHQVLDEPRYREAARRAADFALKKLLEKGRLLRRYREESDVAGYIDDYAFLIMGLLDLYEATFDARYFAEATRLTEEMVRLFQDEKAKGFFFVGKDGEGLIARTKEFYDGAIPSGNSVAALNLLRLGEWTSETKWKELGEETLEAFGGQIAGYPSGTSQGLVALDFLLDTPKEIVLAGEPGSEGLDALLRTIHGRFIPNKVIALVPPGGNDDPLVDRMPMLKDRGTVDGKATAYVCENYTCKLPTNDPTVLATQLE